MQNVCVGGRSVASGSWYKRSVW